MDPLPRTPDAPPTRDRRGVAAALIALASLPGCGVVGFEVAQDLPEQHVAGSPLGGLLPSLLASPVPLTVDIRAETERRNTGPATAAFLRSLSLRITPESAPSGTFDFLDEVRIAIEASDGSLPRNEIARLSPVPRGAVRVDFAIVAGVDLLPYANKGAQITATATGRQPAKDVTFDGRLTIDIRL